MEALPFVIGLVIGIVITTLIIVFAIHVPKLNECNQEIDNYKMTLDSCQKSLNECNTNRDTNCDTNLSKIKYQLNMIVITAVVSSLLAQYQGRISNIPIDVIKQRLAIELTSLNNTFNSPFDVENDIPKAIEIIKALNPGIA